MIIFLSVIIKLSMVLIKNAKVSQVAVVPCSEHHAFLFFQAQCVGKVAYISYIFAVLRYELLFLSQE